MARQTRFYVQTFERKGARLIQSSIREFKTPVEAMRNGDVLSDKRSGVLVYSIEVDADADDWGDPVMMAHYGELPEEAMA
jgi:hypothetical protein